MFIRVKRKRADTPSEILLLEEPKKKFRNIESHLASVTLEEKKPSVFKRRVFQSAEKASK